MMDDISGVELPLQICVVGDALGRDTEFLSVCQQFGHPVLLSMDGIESMTDSTVRTVFILDSFSGPVFDRLNEARKSILGPPAVRDLVHHCQPLLVKKSPVFCLTLFGCFIVLSGYRRKADLERLLRLVQRCGGSVQRDVGKKMTQLVAASSLGDKYQYATTFSIPVLTENWLIAAWNRKEEMGYRAGDAEISQNFKLLPFAGNMVQFYGFETEEMNHMKEVLASSGGKVVEEGDWPSVTHLVVDENTIQSLPTEMEAGLRDSCCVVKGEWFWNSIQIEAAADVSKYRWGRNGIMSPGLLFSPPTPGVTPGTSNKKRKRMRRAEMIQSLAADSPAHKRRSSVGDLAMMSISGSFLDTTEKEVEGGYTDNTIEVFSPGNSPLSSRGGDGGDRPVFDMKNATARQRVFHEFVTTETNYVGILESIAKISREAEDPDQQGGALLDQQEMKIIFGEMPPILKVHSDMLARLVSAETTWTEDTTVGTIILTFAADLLRAYPPFVNFFERVKNQISDSDRRNPRFHAFLKTCERRPECSRQTLAELMIRPVQRLGSICLLLTDLLKQSRKSDPNHADCLQLENALAKVKEVMTHLNEEKRRTEGQIHIFDIYSEIENCPASLVSSHRSFICRADCVEVAAEDLLCGRGYELTLFVFTDILVVAKRKNNKTMTMIRSPSTASLATGPTQLTQNKALKFVQTIHLSAVRRLVDVIDTDNSLNSPSIHPNEGECPFTPGSNNNLVAIVCRPNEDLRERCYTLQMLVANPDEKIVFLRSLCRNVANTMCRPDPDQLLVKLTAKDMSLDASDLNVSRMSRTLTSFHKTKLKVGRAFSFNKTPNKMKRAVSTMISPMSSKTLDRASTPSDSMRELNIQDDCGLTISSPTKNETSTGSLLNGFKAEVVSPYGLQRQDTISQFCKSGGQQDRVKRREMDTVSLCDISENMPSCSVPTENETSTGSLSKGFREDKVSPYGLQRQDTVSQFCKSGGHQYSVKLQNEMDTVSLCNFSDHMPSCIVEVGGANGSFGSTPLSSRKGLQSCVDLLGEDQSPRSNINIGPKKLSMTQRSPLMENRDSDFRTPNLCSRPSFRDKFRTRTGTFGNFSRKNLEN